MVLSTTFSVSGCLSPLSSDQRQESSLRWSWSGRRGLQRWQEPCSSLQMTHIAVLRAGRACSGLKKPSLELSLVGPAAAAEVAAPVWCSSRSSC